MTGPAPRRIAIVPAYNEEPSVATVLDRLYPLVDELVVVDDGSTDGTLAEIERWRDQGRPNLTLLVHDVNQGMSEAYYTALTQLKERLQRGELDENDLVFTVDADGQHDLNVLDELVELTQVEQLDANLARRDMSYHGAYKKTGNWVLSKWASLWANAPLHDVESGYRIFRLGPLAHALDFYQGYQYSETVEVAVVMCQLGYRVRNDHLVPVPVSRSRTSMRDALIDVAMIPAAAMRVWRRDRVPEAFRTDAFAHLAIASVLGILLTLTYVPETNTLTTLVSCAVAAFTVGALVRHLVPRPALALLAPFIAWVTAWLLPQRADLGSSIVLCALFGAGAALAAPGVRRPRPLVLGGAFAVLVVVRIAGTRTTMFWLCIAAVFGAALASRFGRVGMPRTQRGRTIVTGAALVLATTMATAYFGANTVDASWFGGGVTNGDRNSNEVAITFDDGPNIDTTPAIMKILDDAGVKGTFFAVGKAIDAEPQIVRDLYEHDHLLGNHSYHHDNWRWLDPRYPELERTQEAFDRAIGTCPIWFRPPHGQHTPLMAMEVRDQNMKIAMWDVSATDWFTNDPQQIANNVLDKVEGGSIIDMHDGLDGKPEVDRMAVARALPLILDGLRERNLQPVRLDELVGGGDYQPCNKNSK
ncbi:MAG TPA: polysaccharide deacetylase family protein [Acidimicrobiia bacterium]|nr:polysaccharide deacetylase family protein [Acidimicrobiia bacterium]